MQVHPTYTEDEDIVQTTNREPKIGNIPRLGYWQGNL
jgi:hypothetical protein